MSGGDQKKEKEDERYTAQFVLQLLEAEYKDEGCQILFNAITALPSHNPKHLLSLIHSVERAQSATLSADDWHRAVSLFDLEVAKCVHQIVINILLRELRHLSAHTKYWQNSLKHPVSHFFVNGRWEWLRNRPRGLEWSTLLTSWVPYWGNGTAWFKYIQHMQRVDVNEKLQRLELCAESFAGQVGHLHSWIANMEKITSLRNEVRLFMQYVAKLYDFVSGETATEARDALQLLRTLKDTLNALPEFELWFVTQLEPYRKPSHLRRHWVGYTALGAAGLFIGNKLYSNRAELVAWGASSATATRGLFRTHVTEPVSTLYNSVFHTFRDRELLQANRDSLDASRRSLQVMLHDFGANAAKENAAREGKSVQVYMNELPARAAASDMTIVMPHYEKDVRQPLRSIANGELVSGLLIQVQKVKVDTEAAMLAMDQVLKSNEINFSLMAIVPAFILASMALIGIKRWIFRRPSRTDLHRRMRRCLRRVESILITHYGANKPELDFKSTGLILLYLEKLETHVRAGLPPEEQTDILADIKQLRSLDLDVQQKHLMIARMYRAYSMSDKY